MTKIYSGLVGTHARPIDHTITGQVLPVTLMGDFPEIVDAIQKRHRRSPRAYWAITIEAVRQSNKLAYIGGIDPAKFMGMVTLQDAGLLTRDIPLDINYCEPYQRWRHLDGTYDAYIERIREVCTELAVALRMVLPNARLVACEAFDITSLTATSDAVPHPMMRGRWSKFRESCKVWDQWEIATSIYPNGEWASIVEQWSNMMTNRASVAFVTPISGGQMGTSYQLAKTLSILQSAMSPDHFEPRFRDVVIWGNPQSEDDARQHADIASAAVRLAANPTVNPQ